MDYLEPSMITEIQPKSYEWLSEEDKKQFVIRSLQLGRSPAWIKEEAEKFGIQLLID